ncbi:MAG: alpha/beta hydrolase [Bryobacteraceae bacterium]
MRRASALPVLLAVSALALQADAEWKTDIEFARAGDVSLTLDAWIPEGKGPFPTVIVVHGGGWEAGDKQTFVQPLFEPLRKSGFTWFTVNYRLAPQHPFPACTDDVFKALEWVKDHAREYKVDRRRIALMGESAGGHIVAYVGARGRGKTSVRAVVDFYGVHDMLKREHDRGGISRNLKQLLHLETLDAAADAKLAEASPIQYVHKGMPPFLFIHGTKDAAVPFEQSPMMCEKMRSVGARCEVYPVEDAPHGVGPWEKNPAWQKYKTKMIEWLKQELR